MQCNAAKGIYQMYKCDILSLGEWFQFYAVTILETYPDFHLDS